MSERIHIKPARSGLRVVDPETNVPIPEDGTRVVPGQYWNRRIASGEVVQVKGGSRKSAQRQPAPTPKPTNDHDQTEG